MQEQWFAWLEMLESWHPLAPLVIVVVVGAAAGLVNTMAGGGSFFTVPILVALGLPPLVANGSIRLGVILQNSLSSLRFLREGRVELSLLYRLLPAVCLGAFTGTQLAIRVDNETFKPIFGGALLVWAVLLLVRPGRFVKGASEPRDLDALGLILGFCVGVYGGFLQAGVGFPIIALLVLYLGRDAVAANAIKLPLVWIYTAINLPFFWMAGHVSWKHGLALGLGMLGGSWMGVHWQIRSGAEVVRWFVLVMIVVSGILMLV